MQKLGHIDGGQAFDWGRASEDYAKYRDIYPEEFYRRIADLGLCVSGQAALDLGTGTGVLPRNMYHYGAKWTGTDISCGQVEKAKLLAAERGQDINFFSAPAENTGLPDGAFDVITACQCFFYFDKEKVLPEIARMLEPGGHFLILFMAWLPGECEIAARSEELVLRHNPLWSGGGMKRIKYSVPEWSKELFLCENIITYDLNVPFTRQSWHGRMLACRGTGASMDAEAMSAFVREHAAMLEKIAPETFDIPHFASIHDFKGKKQKGAHS